MSLNQVKQYKLITFHNTTAAMLFEKLAKINQIPGRLIPLPKQIDAGCGLAFSYECDAALCMEILNDEAIEYKELCEVTF